MLTVLFILYRYNMLDMSTGIEDMGHLNVNSFMYIIQIQRVRHFYRDRGHGTFECWTVLFILYRYNVLDMYTGIEDMGHLNDNSFIFIIQIQRVRHVYRDRGHGTFEC